MAAAKIAIIGAGVVGLAVAAKLSEKVDGIYVFEKNKRFGQETSSHNSGVIHSGIHYPKNTLKAELCVKGNVMLYDLCKNYKFSHKRLGKLTVAVTDAEIEELEKLMKQGEANGAEDLTFLDKRQVKSLEPHVEVERALLTPSTGILEPDELMGYFYAAAQKNGAVFAVETEVTSIGKLEDSYEVSGVSVGERFTVEAETVVNCAGLNSERIAAMPGLDAEKLGYRIYPCKGDYFRVVGNPPVKMLVYPVPKGAGLGIHLTPDLGGVVKLGPNAYYVDKINYEVESGENEFREDVKRFLPIIEKHRVLADSSGVRPKLQGPKDGFRDFVIRHEAGHGLFGLINLVGIESPGLTASPAIAEFVSDIYHEEVKC